jgi:hypothetical protein
VGKYRSDICSEFSSLVDAESSHHGAVDRQSHEQTPVDELAAPVEHTSCLEQHAHGPSHSATTQKKNEIMSYSPTSVKYIATAGVPRDRPGPSVATPYWDRDDRGSTVVRP